MFHHDIEVNFNLNRMGVAWFQQHSPKTSSQASRIPTGHQNRNLNNSSPKERNLRQRHPFSSEPVNESVSNARSTPRRQANKNHGLSFGNDILKTPTKVHQSKRFCQMPKPSKRKGREEPLELVDVIDIEDEDHSASAFFVGINNNNNGLLSRPKTNHIQTGKIKSSNEPFLFDNMASSNGLFQPTSNKSSFNLKPNFNNAIVGNDEFNGTSSNRNATSANIINAVNTITISNGERLQSSVMLLKYFTYFQIKRPILYINQGSI